MMLLREAFGYALGLALLALPTLALLFVAWAIAAA